MAAANPLLEAPPPVSAPVPPDSISLPLPPQPRVSYAAAVSSKGVTNF